MDEPQQTQTPRVQARPQGDRVLIKVMEPQVGTVHSQQTFGLGMLGLQVQEQEPKPDPKPARGIIVSAGPGYVVQTVDGRVYVPLDVKVGDDVLFFEERGMPIQINDEDLVLLHAEWILVVLDSMDGKPAEASDNTEV